jgi:hypothetical protein
MKTLTKAPVKSPVLITGIPRCARFSLLREQAELHRLGEASLGWHVNGQQHGLVREGVTADRTISFAAIQTVIDNLLGRTDPQPTELETDDNPQVEMGTEALYLTFERGAGKKNQYKFIWRESIGWEFNSRALVPKAHVAA